MKDKDIYFDEEKNEVIITLRVPISNSELRSGGYITVDEDGRVCFSEEEPSILRSCWDCDIIYYLNVSDWKSLILELPKKELTEEDVNAKLYEKLKQLSKEEKLSLLKEMK